MSLVGPDELSGIEAGRRRPDADAVARLAETYGCSVAGPRATSPAARPCCLRRPLRCRNPQALPRNGPNLAENRAPTMLPGRRPTDLGRHPRTDVTSSKGKSVPSPAVAAKRPNGFRRLFVLGLAASAGASSLSGQRRCRRGQRRSVHPAPATTAGVALTQSGFACARSVHSPSVTTAPSPIRHFPARRRREGQRGRDGLCGHSAR